MKTLRKVSTAGIVRENRISAVAREQISSLSIKTPSSRTPIASLSGGNQQKVVLARTLLAKPKVLLAEEPTQGVDAGARVDIYRILRDAADNGAAVVILSSDGVELEGLCDRVLIMSRGEIIAELDGDDVDRGRDRPGGADLHHRASPRIKGPRHRSLAQLDARRPFAGGGHRPVGVAARWAGGQHQPRLLHRVQPEQSAVHRRTTDPDRRRPAGRRPRRRVSICRSGR